MPRRLFTMIELIVAMGVLMLLAALLSSVFVNTTQMAGAQVFNMDMNIQGQKFLDRISDDLRRIKTVDPGLPNARVILNGLAGTLANPPSLAFVTSVPELHYDALLAGSVGRHATLFYDAGVTVATGQPVRTFHGMQEVAYYLTRDAANQEYLLLHRAVKAPIGTVGSTKALTELVANDFNNTQADFNGTKKNYPESYIISASPLFYMDFEYIRDLAVLSSWDGSLPGQGMPDAVRVSVALASGIGSGQMEGSLVSSSATKLVVDDIGGVHPRDGDMRGYALVGSGAGSGVFHFSRITSASEPSGMRRYTLEAAPPNVAGYKLGNATHSAGVPVLLGFVFTRTIPLR